MPKRTQASQELDFFAYTRPVHFFQSCHTSIEILFFSQSFLLTAITDKEMELLRVGDTDSLPS